MGTQEITAARYYQGVKNTTPPSQQHTGAVVPVWGSGPGASRILGTNDHTDLFRTLGG